MATAKKMGLRERKKHLTRESIAEAALALSMDRGLTNVTIDEIADLAFVSPRTVSNYFSCKEEAVAAAGTHDLESVVEQLAARPDAEPTMVALRHVFVDFARSRPPNQLRLEVEKIRLEQEHPSLRPYWVARYDALEAAVRDAVAARTGTDPAWDIYPSLAAAAAVSAVSASMRLWARGDAAPAGLADLIDAAFDQIDAGLRAPGQAGTPPTRPTPL
ncbi:TetR/AcrR family transcriptional regulator [Georgenia sp. SYP-B2076]|uniref:TetR/AcrR family transcriptional regulator n=1 Tax=Georgenia sp. SYP-B2076 TaxID=2495881 RepID=UPI0013DE98C3|nr:TetR/AcrR family transcriptional regulator [Georgenia sp. SYP-B2076]